MWEEQYGRLAINFPPTGHEPNVAVDLTAPAHNPPNLISRRSSLCSQISSGNEPTELYINIQDCEKSRQEQYLLITELRSRERAHQETLCYMRDDVQVLRETRLSVAEFREKACQDAISHEGENILDTEFWGSHSTVDDLTQQQRELQEVTNSLNGSPGKPSVARQTVGLPEFFPALTRRDQCHQFNTRDLGSLSGDVFDDQNFYSLLNVTSFPTAAQAQHSKAAARVSLQ